MKIMHDFLRYDRIVMNISTTNKSHLKVRDTLVEMSFKSLGQNLGDGFIGSIIKNYWPIVINHASFSTLRDKSNEGSVKSSKHVASSIEVNHSIYQVQVSGFPNFFEKNGGQTSRTWLL